MVFSPGIFSRGFAVNLRCRVFFISWDSPIRCCANGRRDYSGSLPVKYIPIKSSENKENGAVSLPLKYMEEKHNGSGRVYFHKNSSRRFLDVSSTNHGDINMDVEEEVKGDSMALRFESVEEPEEIAENNSRGCSGIQLDHSRPAVEKLAIELLASRAFTAVELKKKLQAKKFPLDIVETVISDFQTRGLINDCLYAESYSRSRWSSSSWGPRRIRQALCKKGISEVDTQNAIKQVFESEESADQDSGITMSKLSIDQLYVQASKQWQRSRGSPQDTRKSRMVRWLQYRGFNWSVTNYVLKKLESENPS